MARPKPLVPNTMVTYRLPADVVHDIGATAERLGMSRTKFVTMAARRAIKGIARAEAKLAEQQAGAHDE